MEVQAEAEAKESQINISHFNSLPRANAVRDNQIVQNLDFTSHFHDIYLIILLKELKTKINTVNRLKSYRLTRNEFILTLPIGFSIRGLVKQTGVTLLYIEVFHCCSYMKGNTQRENS